jgi:hypothetical protein
LGRHAEEDRSAFIHRRKAHKVRQLSTRDFIASIEMLIWCSNPICGFEGVDVLDKEPVDVRNPRTFVFLGVTMANLSGTETGEEFSLIEATLPPGGDGRLDLYSREDEPYLLIGALDVSVGDRAFIPHWLRNTDARLTRALLMNTPSTFDEPVCRAGFSTGQEPVHSTFLDKHKFKHC